MDFLRRSILISAHITARYLHRSFRPTSRVVSGPAGQTEAPQSRETGRVGTGSSFDPVMVFQLAALIPLLWAVLHSWLYGHPRLQLGGTTLIGRHLKFSGVDFFGGA